VAAVEASGQAENTIIVYTSDNGCSPKADFDELATFGHNPSYHFRGHKADIYDGGHRIPLIIRWPAVIPAGGSSDQIVCLGDLFATVAEITGHGFGDDVAEDSVSNLSIWRGEAGTQADAPVREAIVHHSVNGSFSIRQGRWKLEMCPGSGGWSYDMEADVGEQINLQDRHPEIVSALTALLTDYVRRGRSTPGEPQDNTGAKHWPQLNWLREHDL
jgi:arylsulfatase A-like enzyme